MGSIETPHVSDTWKCGSLSFIFTHPPEDLKKKSRVSVAGIIYFIHDEDGEQVHDLRRLHVANDIGWGVLHEYCVRHAVVVAAVFSGALQYE